jgi:hypothetical protein
MFFSISPYAGYAAQNAQLFTQFFNDNGVSLPPEGMRHYITHCDEFSLPALISLLKQYSLDGCPEGVHEYGLSGKVVTRLWGPECGNSSVLGEERFLAVRGQGRNPEEVIVREKPFQEDDRGVIIQFGGVVWTAHSGPSMPKMEDDPEGLWESNAIAYSRDELRDIGVPCYKWRDMGEGGSEQLNFATRFALLKHYEGDEEAVDSLLAVAFATKIPYQEYKTLQRL